MNLSLGLKIRELRKANGLNQSQMAAMLGVHLQTISRYEKGKLVPSPAVLSVLAEKFKVDANSLLRDEDLVVREEQPGYGVPQVDPITQRILEMLKGMDEEKRRDVLKYTKEKKQLAELMAERESRKAG